MSLLISERSSDHISYERQTPPMIAVPMTGCSSLLDEFRTSTIRIARVSCRHKWGGEAAGGGDSPDGQGGTG
eukprot:5326491-Pleurochrysis_carterae.AAC.2